ncbi:major facilitator superfamily protein [Lichtheimia corymbifera JMRC:FSU:9682]|uniref:Major facilitator superfamily protein n=1 Tax=Lichtheimia corymbifera JMRC:FSU:9682 TaxID=1263082 RepID=A0A068S4K4_9FUNG|nr:major facilitator superfamily protein [Lichtheimia corymbifera JMRC:FSU:9682]
MTTIDDDSSLSTRVGSEKASIKTSKNKRNFRQGGAILAVPVCYSMVGINITLLSPSLTRIALDLGNLGGRQWIVTYMITYLATTPITGKAEGVNSGDPSFCILPYWGCIGTKFTTLIVARGLQGFGGGVCVTVPSIVMDDIAPIEKKALYQSLVSLVMGISNVVGPIIGGAFTDQVSWRRAFWLNVALGTISLLMTVLFVEETVVIQEASALQKLKHIDWFGIMGIFAFVTTLLLFLQWGPDDSWSSPRVIATASGTGLALLILIAVESLFAKDPLLATTSALFYTAFFGVSLRRTATIIGVRATCSNDLGSMAISLVTFVMSVGFTLGLPIFEMVHKITLAKEIDAMDPTVKEQAKRTMGNTGTDYIAIHRMPSQAQDAVTHAYMNSMLQVFRFPLIVGGVMLALALLMKNIRYP